jgi:hypothetical protein
MRNGSTMGGASLIVAIIALSIAVSGAALALPGKNSVDSGDIQKNAVKSKHLASSALKCPGNMRRVAALCYDKQPRDAQTFLIAHYECAQAGRELPSWPELLRIAHTNAYPTGEGEMWTAENVGNTDSLVVNKIASNNIPSLVNDDGLMNEFRCVREATP